MDAISKINLETKGWIASSTKKMKESSPDDLINAWEKGVLRGLNLKDKIIGQYFTEKVNEALNTAEKLFNKLNDKIKIDCTEVFFKINDLTDFDFLYIVDLDSYLSDKLNHGLSEALKVKQVCKSKDLGFNFIFKPLTKNINQENIFADGYVLKYAPQSRQT